MLPVTEPWTLGARGGGTCAEIVHEKEIIMWDVIVGLIQLEINNSISYYSILI